MRRPPLLVPRTGTDSHMSARPLAHERGPFVLACKRGVLELLLMKRSSVFQESVILLALWEELELSEGWRFPPLASLPSDVVK